MKTRFTVCFLLMLLLGNCPASISQETGTPDVPPPSTEAPPEPEKTDAELLLERMTLREKTGQLFMVRLDALDFTKTQAQIDGPDTAGVTKITDTIAENLKTCPVGGIVLFSKNIRSPEQVTALNQALQEASEIPLLTAVDEEGGVVARLANAPGFDLPKYKSAAAVGQSGNAADGFEMGRSIGSYLHEYGFHMDFAPVADVNTNPDNPVIGTRAFSSDAATVAAMAGAMADGLRSQGVIPVFKHFPGHGDTAEDSHIGIAVSGKTEAELRMCEWIPFARAGAYDGVMVGHIALPNVTGDMTPATMSRKIISGILKESLGFEGLVITDSLAMGAITERYTPGEAALAALNAGCDLLLMPYGLKEAIDAVEEAVRAGTFQEEKLNETVLRILTFKQIHGLLGT